LEIHHKDPLYKKSRNKLGIVMYGLTRERFFLISEKLTNGDQFQVAQSGSSMILPVARMDEQLTLLKEAYSGIKVILLVLPFSPKIEKDIINFDYSESLKIIDSAEQVGGFYIINPQHEFDKLVNQGHFPRGFMNSLPGIGHLNVFGNRVIGDLLDEKILEITQ